MRLKSFYLKSEIQTGFYANPGEWVLEDGTEYVGVYCLAAGIPVTGETPTNKSQALRKGGAAGIYHLRPENIDYFNLRKKRPQYHNHKLPVYYQPVPTPDDYIKRQFTRYFVQKINQLDYIVEIDKDQYKDANSNNKPGINLLLFRRGQITWSIKGQESLEYNERALIVLEDTFPGIREYFSYYGEYVI
jgi:hypothetical protein